MILFTPEQLKAMERMYKADLSKGKRVKYEKGWKFPYPVEEEPNTEHLDHIDDRTAEMQRLINERDRYESGSEQWKKYDKQIQLIAQHKTYR